MSCVYFSVGVLEIACSINFILCVNHSHLYIYSTYIYIMENVNNNTCDA